MEDAGIRHQRPLSTDVAAIMLAVFISIETLSILGWSHSVTSTLEPPLNKIISPSIIAASLLGIYGLANHAKIGDYTALLASAFEMTLGALYISKSVASLGVNATTLLQAVTAIALGILTTACVFKKSEYQQSAGSASPPLDSSDSEYPLEIVDLHKIYDLGPTQVAAINGLSLKIRRGETVAIMGPSGSGKSTLLNLIGALDRPTSGHIYIDGVDIATLDDMGLARLRNEKIGFVFQSYNLIDRSKVMRNMELPAMVKGYSKNERREKAQSLLKTVGLSDKADRRPKTMSGGEQQRVAIARALINDPKIILADEPTGNLDSKTGHEIMAFLKKTSLEKKSTLIIVTHSREVGEMTDRIINIRDGIIVNEERLKNL